MLRTTSGSRVLDGRDLDEVLALLDRDPVAHVFVASRIESAGLAACRLGAQVWGYGERGRLEALCYSGANLVPLLAGPEALPRLRRPGPPAGPALLVDRRGRPTACCRCGGCSSRSGAAPGRCARPSR